MLAPLEAVAVAAVAPIDNARKRANATAERAPADLLMASQQARVHMTLNNPVGSTTLHGAVDRKTGIGRQLTPHASKPTATHRATEANPTRQPRAHATTMAARPVTNTSLQGASVLKSGIGQPTPADPQPPPTAASTEI